MYNLFTSANTKGMFHSLTMLVLLCVVPFAAFAGGGHDHSHDHQASVEPAPHGGMLRDSLPFKTELVLNQDTATIYVYDKDLKQVQAARLGVTAEARLAFPKERNPRTIVIPLIGDVYQGELEGIDKVHRFDLHVDITVDGKKILGDFGVDNIH